MNQAVQVAIYVLCLVAAGACAVLLLRGFSRSRTRLLLWVGICFSFLALNSLAVLLDLLIFLEADLLPWRHTASLAAVSVLLAGLVWESD